MEVRKRKPAKKEYLEDYTEQINWDSLFFKSLLLFGSIFLICILAVILWML